MFMNRPKGFSRSRRSTAQSERAGSANSRIELVLVELTCALDGHSHRIEQADHGAGIAEGRGRYTALCGRSVFATSLCTVPGPLCASCRAVVTALESESRERPHRNRRGRRSGRHRPCRQRPDRRLSIGETP